MRENRACLDVHLAYSLKSLFDDAKDNDPARAHDVVAALKAVAEVTADPRVAAVASWTAGIAALLIDGQAESAIARLDVAASLFAQLDEPLQAAATQVSKLHALAMLGRYTEAFDCGLRVRDVFIAHGDALAAGKIEQNLGNIHFRLDRYSEAEQLYLRARALYADVNDQRQLVQIDTCLATALILQHKFKDGEHLYRQALARAETTGQLVAQAAIECDLGVLAFLQGRYDQALSCFEKSRRRYAALGMVHESAIADKELADAYLELNLAPEADEIYARIIPTFSDLGMRAEQARSLAYRGRACLLLGRLKESRTLLAEARALYEDEGNLVGRAMVTLAEAQLDYADGNYADAAAAAERAEVPLEQAGAWERSLLARWLRGEALRAQGDAIQAKICLSSTLRDAEQHALPQLAHRCHTSLGYLAASSGLAEKAEASFKRAVELIEDLRVLLPSDEFRTAFVGDKLTPYTELARLCLADDAGPRVADALDYVERARSRALVDMLGGALRFRPESRDPFEAGLLEQLEELREELNWFYSRINHPGHDGPRSAAAIASLRQSVRERESKVQEIMRQLEQRGGSSLIRLEPFNVAELQRDLGAETALVEYMSLDGELLAFVVTSDSVEVVRELAREEAAGAALDRLRFQINSLRYGAERMRRYVGELSARARHHLSALYDMLLRPIEERLGSRRLIVVPHRALHYVPFHALYDGAEYVIQRREVCYAPSAGVLQHCLAGPRRALRRALLLGVSDAQAPRVRDEVDLLAPLFPEAEVFVDEGATLAVLREHAPGADVVHLACHGEFRSDNPLFSSLKLSDGWLTVRDAYKLELNCGLVALSACETGMSAVAPGDELIGLARGFFSAGARSLLVTLWRVDDEETSNLMSSFYSRLVAGDTPAAALRYAQCEMLGHQPHPFFWSPFILLGRW
ncbi:MAG TPA: CHAT domain-containing tetratricopeptide repeat protein [Blastocatellia bacterium]|nr:CHAT domain-containing tetratricopeptide repeat protein [Blastocatellia bacterium]